MDFTKSHEVAGAGFQNLANVSDLMGSLRFGLNIKNAELSRSVASAICVQLRESLSRFESIANTLSDPA